MISITHSVHETQKIAAKLAERISKSKPQKHAIIIALEGELGAGKTTFIKGFAKAFGIKGPVNSPTFILIHPYKINFQFPISNFQQNSRTQLQKLKTLYHVDAYRINTYKDLIPLGIKEILADKENIVLIEWAERIKSAIPRNAIWVHIDHVNENMRKLTVNYEL